MIDLKYTLKQDELREYYETALMNDAEINKFHYSNLGYWNCLNCVMDNYCRYSTI